MEKKHLVLRQIS